MLKQPPTPVLLTVYFSAALKALVIGNLFKLFRVCHLGSLPLGDKHEENMTITLFFSLPQWQSARANVMANLSSLNKLPNTRVFVAAENGSVEVLELVALFLLKTGRLRC